MFKVTIISQISPAYLIGKRVELERQVKLLLILIHIKTQMSEF